MLPLRANYPLKVHWLFVIVTLLAYCLSPTGANASTAIDNGFKTISSAGAGNGEVTGEKPESKLWFNDGLWWGVLWDTQAGGHHIFRFDPATQDWIDTGTVVDPRTSSRSDVLWANNKLYVTSHKFTTTALPDTNAANRGRLYRYSYNATTKLYTIDAGFPVDVTGGTAEALTLARDTTGKLWVTYTESLTSAGPGRVMVNRTTTGTNDLVWGTPFVLPVTDAANLEVDDIASIIAYNGRVGIQWSNQATTQKTHYFASHVDGAADATWQSAPMYTTSSDDHMNLKYVPGAGGAAGTLYSVVKTSRNQELIVLLVCTNGICTSAGDWASYTVYDSNTFVPTRPIVVVDTDNSELYVFTSNQVAGSGTPYAIYYKKTSTTNIQFTPGDSGTPFIRSSTDITINNPTSTKQNLTAATGLLVLGSDEIVDFYFHNYLQLASTLAPEVTSFNPVSGGAGTQVTVTGNRFTGSTAVAFNSIPAVFTVNSNTQITTTVPVGATTGPISVTNAAGTRSSAANFTVLAGAPVIVTGLQASNTGTLSTTATISCLGQPNKQQLLLPGQSTIIPTGWTAPCSPISISNQDVPPSGPVITNVAASLVTTTDATITWTTNVISNTRVDYGTTTAYGSNTATNTALVISHSQALTGLAPATLYHYRVRSTDGAGIQTISGDFTFTTLTAPGGTGIVIGTTVFGDRSTAATTVVTTAFSTTTANELLLALVSADTSNASGTNNSVTSVTGGGLTWVLVRRTNTQRGTAEIWRTLAPVPLTNVTVTATLLQSAASSMTVMSFRGVNTSGTSGSGAIGATGSGNAASGAPTASLTTTGAGSLVVGVGIDWDGAAARTVGANQTLIHQLLVTNIGTFWTQRQNATTPASGTVVTINDTAPTNHRYNVTVAEILAAP